MTEENTISIEEYLENNKEVFIPLKGKGNERRFVGTDGTTGKFITDEDVERQKKYAIRDANRKENKFYNVVTDKITYLIEEVGLTDSELAYLWYIGRKVDYYTEYSKDEHFIKLLQSRKTKVGMNNQDLRKMVGLEKENKKRTWQLFKNKCIDFGVMQEINKEFYLNKAFIFKGKMGGLNAVSTRITTTDYFLKEFKPKDIGVLINLQRFIHAETLCLVENPHETDLSKLVYIKSQRHLEKVSGLNRTAFQRIWKMKVDGRCIITFFKNDNRQGYVVNPQIFYKGEFNEAIEKYSQLELLF